MKNNKIHIVRTSGLIGVLVLGAITAAMIFNMSGRETKQTELARAQNKAEAIAYQIVEIYKMAKVEVPVENTPAQRRGLASVQSAVEAGGILKEFKNQGTMGIDPWGHSYQYRILATNSAEPQLIVWSLGPNGALDNQVFMEDSNEAALAPLQGDDIRVQLPLSELGSN